MSRLGSINSDLGFGIDAVGSAVLVGGTVTVNNSSISANSIIILTAQLGILNLGFLYVSTRVNGVSFTINSSNILDTRTVGYLIVNP
jgi:hypothetical protein